MRDNGKNTTFQGKFPTTKYHDHVRFAFFDCQEEKTCLDQEPAAILEFMESNCKALWFSSEWNSKPCKAISKNTRRHATNILINTFVLTLTEER